jgi:DNA-binding GntR family transcriptional regulator
VRCQLPALNSVADAAGAMAAIAAALAAGEITSAEAAELSAFVASYVKTIEASDFDRRIQLLEAKTNAKRP